MCTGCGGKPAPKESSGPSGAGKTEAPAKAKAAALDPQRLVGEWLRPDGGYVIKIASVAADGTVDASYLNPSPINVERARAAVEGGVLKLHVKLNDRGYPGCVYSLEYDPENDVMVGTYFQAAMQATYRIRFRRQK
jgi:hypothetical protein